MPEIIEKFNIHKKYSWMIDGEVEPKPFGTNQLTVGGTVLFKDAISKNQRRYVQEEILKATNTLIGRPINVNHNNKHIIGHVKRADFKNDALQFWGIIDNKAYVQRIKANDPAFKGWSVQADYFSNQCVHCGERFLTEEEFKTHMREVEHFHDFEWRPQTIIFNGIALVEEPETPGIDFTTLDLLEMKQGYSRLMETLTSDIKERIEMKEKLQGKVALTPEHHIAIPQKTPEKTKQVKEQEEEPAKTPQEECEAKGGTWDPETETCEMPEKTEEVKEQEEGLQPPVHPTEGEGSECPEGFKYDETLGVCVPEEIKGEEDTIAQGTIETPPIIEQEDEGLQPPVHPTEGEGQECPVGSHFDKEAGVCVPDEIKGEPIPTEGTVEEGPISEVHLPKMLRLGEPCDWSKAGYSSFDDCVSKNQDKGDPNAYCADIMRKIGGETAPSKTLPQNLYESQTHILRLIEDVKIASNERDKTNAKTINQLNEALAKLIKEITTYIKGQRKTLNSIIKTEVDNAKKLQEQTLSESKLRAKYNNETLGRIKTLTEHATKLTETLNKSQETITPKVNQLINSVTKLKEYTDTKLGQLATSDKNLREHANLKLSQLATSDKKTQDTLTQKINEVSQQIKDVRSEIQKQETKIAEQKQDFEKLLNGLDEKVKNEIMAKDKEIKTLEEWKKQHESEEQQKIKETTDATARIPEIEDEIETLKIKTENLEDKQKGNFKAHTAGIKETQEITYSDPADDLRKSAKKKVN